MAHADYLWLVYVEHENDVECLFMRGQVGEVAVARERLAGGALRRCYEVLAPSAADALVIVRVSEKGRVVAVSFGGERGKHAS